MQQYYNILIIYYSDTIQYSLMEISIYCTLQYIVIYCNVFCLNVVSAQSLHHKNDWISRNLGYTLEFFTLLYSYILFFTVKTHIPTWNVFLPKSDQILQYGNILQYTQNTIRNMALTRTYCFTPSKNSVLPTHELNKLS